jgi:hypothetical protein
MYSDYLIWQTSRPRQPSSATHGIDLDCFVYASHHKPVVWRYRHGMNVDPAIAQASNLCALIEVPHVYLSVVWPGNAELTAGCQSQRTYSAVARNIQASNAIASP